jgi:cell division transport system permease protein
MTEPNILRDRLLHANAPEDVRGFLTQVWQSQPTLPLQTPRERVMFFLQRGVETLLALPVSNLLSTLTVAFSLALIGGFVLLISNVERTLSNLGNSLSITAYLSDSGSEAQIKALIAALKGSDAVKSVEFTSKAAALREFKSALGGKSALLSRFEGDNPLPASLDIQLERNSPELNSFIVEKLEDSEIVEEIVSGSDVVEKVGGLLTAVKVIGYGGGAFLFGVVLFLILNTVKLVIYSQRQEIEVMQLVGATQTTVRVPFLVAGAIQGFFGAVVGVMVLRVLYGVIYSSLEKSAMFGAALPLPEFFGLGSVMLILLAGVTLGVVASALAVGRHLEV